MESPQPTHRDKPGGSLLNGAWQCYGEGTSLADGARYADLAVHGGDEVLDDRQAEARSAGGAVSRFVRAVESLEDSR